MCRAATAPPIRGAGQFHLRLPGGGAALRLNGAICWAKRPARGRRTAVGVASGPLPPAERRALTTALYGTKARRP